MNPERPSAIRTGTVRSVHLDFPRGTQRLQLSVWTDDGVILAFTLRGTEIDGAVSEGDRVRFAAPTDSGRLDRLVNLTTGRPVVVRRRSWLGLGGRLLGNQLFASLVGSVVTFALAAAGRRIAGKSIGIGFVEDTTLWVAIVSSALALALFLALSLRLRLARRQRQRTGRSAAAGRRPLVLTVLVTAVTTFAMTVGLMALARTADPGSLSSGHDARAERQLTRAVHDLGGRDCRLTTLHRSVDNVFVAAISADAAIKCRGVLDGIDWLGAVHFDSADALQRYELDNHHYVAGSGAVGDCNAGYGETPWAPLRGGTRGMLYCEPHDDVAQLVWTDGRTRNAFAARAPKREMDRLLVWWRRHVKHAPDGDLAARDGIDRLFGGAFEDGLDGCKPFGHALADLDLRCGAKTPKGAPSLEVSTLEVFHFSGTAVMKRFFDDYKTRFHAPKWEDRQTCGAESFASYPYLHGEDAAGQVFCFPSGSTEWLLWTIDAENVAALISRQDQSSVKLGEAWQKLPPL